MRNQIQTNEPYEFNELSHVRRSPTLLHVPGSLSIALDLGTDCHERQQAAPRYATVYRDVV